MLDGKRKSNIKKNLEKGKKKKRRKKKKGGPGVRSVIGHVGYYQVSHSIQHTRYCMGPPANGKHLIRGNIVIRTKYA